MEECFVVRGGRRLRGSVRLPAAKNSVLPLMAAALLCNGTVRLRRVPHIEDVQTSRQLLAAVGAWSGWQEGQLVICPETVYSGELPARLAGAMRASVFYLAPLLVRLGRVNLPTPGGCRLGPRPIDIHLDGLARMGARIRWQPESITLERHGALHGMDYTLRLPSVGATETLLMAAARAEGVTVLRGAACEPEIADLAAFLNQCGAQIHGAGTPTLVVRGVAALSGCTWTPVEDRIVGCTLAAAAACAGGQVTLLTRSPEPLAPMLGLLRRLGCTVTQGRGGVTVAREGPLLGGAAIRTGSYPAFPSDAAPLAAAVLLFAKGKSVVEDTMFERRFLCAPGFLAMGAALEGSGKRLEIEGGAPLHGAEVAALDLRGGAALLAAALGIPGESRISGVSHIRRGYENTAAQLRGLGADITVL